MSRVLTENQRMLTRYLAAIGCEKGAVFEIIFNLWNDDAVIEMLEFCRDNHPASQARLLQRSLEISLKYNSRV